MQSNYRSAGVGISVGSATGGEPMARMSVDMLAVLDKCAEIELKSMGSMTSTPIVSSLMWLLPGCGAGLPGRKRITPTSSGSP